MLQAAVPPDCVAPRRERSDAAEHRARWACRPERKDLIQTHGIERGVDFPAREQRLDLGGEPQIAARKAIEQRADAEPVAREEHLTLAAVVDRERKLAVQAIEHGR